MEQQLITNRIQSLLFEQQDLQYRTFQAKLMPGVPPEKIIGVRTPILRKLAKTLSKEPEIETYLRTLPHQYYDENNLHGFILSECRDYEKVIDYLEDFLPLVDNWATCDLLSPKIFKKNRHRLKTDIEKWMASSAPFTIRFGIEMLMSHYLDDDFDPADLQKVSIIRSDEYYVNMMVAWYFATALAKQWEHTIGYIEEKRLEDWIHRKTIQKAIESRRITLEQKDYLRTLK